MKKKKSNISNPIDEKYNEFLALIAILCSCYDSSGKEIIALSISAAVRVLVHDKGYGTSLLAHLNKKDIKFISTNVKTIDDKIHLGLVRRINVGVDDGIGGESKYWPNFDERYFPSPKEKKYVSFSNWWTAEKIFISGESSLTREDLVLAVTNKDGGTHFDAKVEKKYDDFRHAWSGGSSLVGNKSGSKRGYDNIPTYPAIRQIAHELICTLKPNKTH